MFLDAINYSQLPVLTLVYPGDFLMGNERLKQCATEDISVACKINCKTMANQRP
jgi:hypothetical protein